jgi:general secretion pathway protein G
LLDSKPETRNRKLKARGFTLLELMAAIMVIGALSAALLDRLAYYQEMAEKAAMESTARLIRTGLQIHLAELILANRQAEADEIERENPVRWLERKPANYEGEYREPLRRGAWYFDGRARQLVYVVQTGRRLEFDAPEAAGELRFRARLLRDRLQLAGGPVESVTGVALQPVTAYRWR